MSDLRAMPAPAPVRDPPGWLEVRRLRLGLVPSLALVLLGVLFGLFVDLNWGSALFGSTHENLLWQSGTAAYYGLLGVYVSAAVGAASGFTRDAVLYILFFVTRGYQVVPGSLLASINWGLLDSGEDAVYGLLPGLARLLNANVLVLALVVFVSAGLGLTMLAWGSEIYAQVVEGAALPQNWFLGDFWAPHLAGLPLIDPWAYRAVTAALFLAGHTAVWGARRLLAHA